MIYYLLINYSEKVINFFRQEIGDTLPETDSFWVIFLKIDYALLLKMTEFRIIEKIQIFVIITQKSD